jgi:uncharacterized membrane protein
MNWGGLFMTQCEKCAAEVPDGSKFCPVCGNAMESEWSRNTYQQQTYQARAPFRPDEAREIEENKGLCVLCYFSILLLIPLLLKPHSAYVRYHCNQGLLLLLLSIAIGAVCWIPIVGWLIAVAGPVFVLICLIMGVVNTLSGVMKPLPLIGTIALL